MQVVYSVGSKLNVGVMLCGHQVDRASTPEKRETNCRIQWGEVCVSLDTSDRMWSLGNRRK